jgi:hypothetical protein
MYGPHTIINEEKLHAIISTKINIQDYKNQTLTIYRNKIIGYPVDGGPMFVDVKRVNN